MKDIKTDKIIIETLNLSIDITKESMERFLKLANDDMVGSKKTNELLKRLIVLLSKNQRSKKS